MTPDVLEIPEVAAALRTSIATVRRLIRTKQLRAGKVGGIWKVTAAALREYREAIGLDPKREPAKLIVLPPPVDDDEATGRRLAARQRVR